MKRIVLFLSGIPLLLAGCQSEESENALLESQRRTDVAELVGVGHDIAVNILASRFGGYRSGQRQTRAMDGFTLTPYVVEGDTLLYVAQYDEGWEIYSASHAANMVLFSSDEGVFDMEDPSMPEQLRFLIKENAAAIGEIPDDTDYIDPSWGGIALTADELSQGDLTVREDDGGRRKIQEGDLPPGRWVLLEVEETGSETYISPKLIKTKWGQNAPWNAYAKWVIDTEDNVLKQCLAGCTPVAFSQYMYFTHFKDGIPATAPSKAYPLSYIHGNIYDYSFINFESGVWDKMLQRYYYGRSANEAALLIGNTGRELNSRYGLKRTQTEVLQSVLPYLNKTYGLQFSCEIFSIETLKESIDVKGYPLLADIFSNRKSDGTLSENTGHTLIIDQYKETTNTFRYLYALQRDPLPPGEKDKWLEDEVDMNGNIINYAYTNEVTKSYSYDNVSMNWGWDGLYDDVFYSPVGGWDADGVSYNLTHYIYNRND